MPASHVTRKDGHSKHRRPTLRQVANLVGVNPSTVSSILNGGRRAEGFAKATKERVQSVAEELGYVPNPLARTLRQSKTLLIGVVVTVRQSAMFRALLEGVKGEAREQGYEVLEADMGGDASRLSHCVQSLTAWRVEGLVLSTGGHPGCQKAMESTMFNDLPYVELACGNIGSGVPSVEFDNERAGRMMAGHLASLGHQRVGVLAGPRGNPLYDERLAGFLACAKERGVEVSERHLAHVADGSHLMSSGREACTSLMQKWPRPTAVVGINDAMAIGAIKGLRDLGVDVPRQVSVAGFDDICFEAENDENRLGEFVYPSLTTVRVPLHDMGREAARRLIGSISGEVGTADGVHVKFPPKLVTRESTARCLPGHAR